MKPHPLVQAEWPWLLDVQEYDFEVADEDVHLGVYVRRVAGDEWYTLAGLVNHVVVAEKERGNGLGRMAVEDALDWLVGVRVHFALLHSQPEAAGFYERCGFRAAPNYPAPTLHGERVSMVAEVGGLPWPTGPVVFVEPW